VLRVVALRAYRVSFTSADGVRQAVDKTAESLYEAAGMGCLYCARMGGCRALVQVHT
jgi:hypothetical protein